MNNYIVGFDPDILFRTLSKNVVDFGTLKDQKFYYNSVVTRCDGNKRYVTCLDHNITHSFDRLLQDIKIFTENVDDIVTFDADVIYNDFNGLSNITVIKKLSNVFDFLQEYSYYSLLLELISCIKGLEVGDVIFYHDLVYMESSNIQHYHNLEKLPSQFYKSNKINNIEKEDLYKTLKLLNEWISKMDAEFNPNIMEISNVGLRDLITASIADFKISINEFKIAEGYIEYIEDNTFEKFYCKKQLNKVVV